MEKWYPPATIMSSSERKSSFQSYFDRTFQKNFQVIENFFDIAVFFIQLLIDFSQHSKIHKICRQNLWRNFLPLSVHQFLDIADNFSSCTFCNTLGFKLVLCQSEHFFISEAHDQISVLKLICHRISDFTFKNSHIDKTCLTLCSLKSFSQPGTSSIPVDFLWSLSLLNEKLL